MKKILIMIAIMLLIAGCGNSSETKITQTIETEEGESQVTVTGTEGKDSWCPEGGEWNLGAEGAFEGFKAEWEVDKLINSGKYKGLCHVYMKYDMEGEKAEIEYYFSEDGKKGYVITEINGQRIEQEYNG